MNSQKNNDLKHCIKCTVLLTEENWLKYLIKRSNYICTPCFRLYGKTYHKTDPAYNIKQRNRYRERRSAIILAYGNKCAECYEDQYEKLTIDHINGGGVKHHKKMSTNIINYLYNEIVNKDGYQVLCYNCNCSKNVIYKDKYNLRDKQKVINNYGGKCEECKEYRIERLTIDHKDNNGTEQRKTMKYGTGASFYRWIIKNKYPSDLGFQVLCFNCNCSKLF